MKQQWDVSNKIQKQLWVNEEILRDSKTREEINGAEKISGYKSWVLERIRKTGSFFDVPTKTRKTEFINIMIKFGTLLAVMEKYGELSESIVDNNIPEM